MVHPENHTKKETTYGLSLRQKILVSMETIIFRTKDYANDRRTCRLQFMYVR